MDTSGTYIKMRLAAIPGLGMGNPPEGVDEDIITGGDIYLFQSPSIFIDAKGDWYYSTETESVQLERQDQLQGMLRDKISYRNSYDLTCLFYRWLDDKFNEDCMVCEDFSFEQAPVSMEQLWLAFVMKEKYNKLWDGNEWILS